MAAPRLNRGPKFLQSAFNGLADYVESIVPIGPTVSDSPTGKGRYIGTTAADGGIPPKCPFALALYTGGDSPTVRVFYGTINGRQPASFHAGDDPPFTVDAAAGYLYAKAVADLGIFQWTSDSDIVFDTDPFKENTGTEVYTLVGSISISDDGVVNVASVCGNVVTDFCDLADES